MSQITEEISQLILLAKQHLSQEYNRDEWLFTDPKTFDSYKSYAQKTKESNAPSSAKPINSPQTRVAPSSTTYKPQTTATSSVKNTKSSLPPNKEEDKPPMKSKTTLERQAPPPSQDNFNDLRKMMGKLFPQQQILDEPLDAQKLQLNQNPEVLVLFSGEPDKHLAFLTNLTKAIQLCLCHAALVSTSEKKFEGLVKSGTVKMLIGSESALKEIAPQIAQITVIPLQNIEALFENPTNKALLWDQICKEYK